MLYRTLLFTLIIPIQLTAQELNIGVHANPTLGINFPDGQSRYDNGLSPTLMSLHFNGGANIQLQHNRLILETGVNLLSKSLGFKQNLVNTGNGLRAHYNIRIPSTSVEVPLQIGYLLHHNQKKSFYDLFLLAGASYEYNSTNGFKGKGISYSSMGNTFEANGIIKPAPDAPSNQLQPLPQRASSWANIIFGFKVNTVIRKIGLVDYGLVYHLPLSNAGYYRVESELVQNGVATTSYTGDFYPVLSYIDIKLTYYFLNFEKGKGRKKYANYSPQAVSAEQEG